MKQVGGRIDSGDSLEGSVARHDYPDIGPFSLDREIMLRPMPNGGWVVEQRGDRLGEMGTSLGAYTTADEMLDVLKRHL